MTDVQKTGVFGTSGYGKSTLVKELIEKRNRVVVFDTMDEYRDAGMESFTSADAFRQRAAALWMSDRMRIAYVPPPHAEPLALHALATFLVACQAPYKFGTDTRPITLVVEEMDLSYPVTALPSGLSGMSFLCNRGRHYGIELIGVSQFPAQISTRFRANMPDVYSFMLPVPVHRAALAQQFGDRIDELAALPKHVYLHYNDGTVSAGNTRLYQGPPSRELP